MAASLALCSQESWSSFLSGVQLVLCTTTEKLEAPIRSGVCDFVLMTIEQL